ncbi:MAG: UDP-2,3-diacylglucosamine diphosphatase LpxI [Xanthobacteraceae bacterium]
MMREGPLAIVCGGGSLPFAVADAVQKRGRRAVLLALRGWADPERVAAYPHHWIGLGQFGAVCRHARAEGCRDMVFIGTLTRPPLWHLRFDWGALRLLSRLVVAYRGGDNHLLSRVAEAFQREGFRLIGAHEVAPEILVPEGALSRRSPNEQERADIARGLELINAIGSFDVGQAAVVAGNRVLAVEAAEGTDRMLARVAELRGKSGASGGVLVKAPKPGQDWRFDLPSIGPQTVESAVRAGLAGAAVMAGGAIVAEPQRVAALADAHDIFVIGVRADGNFG